MGKLEFEYEGLKDPNEIYSAIKVRYGSFDFRGSDADWMKNVEALKMVLGDEKVHQQFKNELQLFTVTDEWGMKEAAFFYYDERIHSIVGVYDDRATNLFDFTSPLDVLALLDGTMLRIQEMKSFYQIKVA